jgi:hypothetical protein
MNADTIIGVVVGISGWVAVLLTWLYARQGRRQELARTCGQLSLLVGQWADRISDTTEFAGDFGASRRALQRLKDRQGEFEQNLENLIGQLPAAVRFDEIRVALRKYRRDALYSKDGMLEYMQDDPPPTPQEWQEVRDRHIYWLRYQCAELQSLLRAPALAGNRRAGQSVTSDAGAA